MRKLAVFCEILVLTSFAFAGFKAKLIKPKKPEQFQAHVTSGGVTFAADLVFQASDQKEYFCAALTPSNIVAVRLAVFNGSDQPVTLPLDTLQFVAPDGSEIQLVSPETVAQAVLQGKVVSERPKSAGPAQTPQTNPRYRPGYDPRRDPTDPRYDPRLDPNDPRYDPRLDPSDPRYDPRMDPSDPRNNRYPPLGGTYPGGTQPYPGQPYPGAQPYPGQPYPGVVLSPGGGGTTGDLSQYERDLAEKDFSDKAHTLDPILPSLNRDKFLYFMVPSRLTALRGYTLRLPAGKGMPQEVVLKF